MVTSRKEFRNVDLQSNEIQDLVIENLASDPSGSGSGRLYYNTTDSKLKLHDGTSFVEVGSGDSAVSVISASFNTGNGVLTLTMSDSSTVTVDLDNRYLQNLEVDSTLSTTSTNPVENQAVTNEINTKQDTITGTTDITLNELTTNGDITVKEDQDMSIVLGRLRIDSRFSDTWNLSHYDLPQYQFSGNDATVSLNGPTYIRLQSDGNTIASVIDDGIEFQSGNH